jgi:peptide/nickel transport system permease protein
MWGRIGAMNLRSRLKSLRYGVNPFLRELKFVLHKMRGSIFSLVGIIIIVFFVGVALMAPVIAPPRPNAVWHGDPYLMKMREDWKGAPGITPPPTPPSPEHPFGTVAGYDIYYGCVWGTRTVFRVGLLVTLVALAIGLIVGCLAGYFGGIIDQLLMLFTDIFLGIPSLLLTMLLIVATIPRVPAGPPQGHIEALRMSRIIIALAVTAWPTYARLVRGEVIRVKNENYVEAAKAVGCSDFRTIGRHILPNSISSVIAMASLNVGGVILAISTLTYLGIGIPEGYADWTPFIVSSRNYIIPLDLKYAYTFMIPSVFLIIFILGWTLLGDTLKGMLDPRIRRM